MVKAAWHPNGMCLPHCLMTVCSIQALISLVPSFPVKPPTPAPSWEACQSSDQAFSNTAAHAPPFPQPLLNISATSLWAAFAPRNRVLQDRALHADTAAQHDTWGKSATLLSSPTATSESNAAAAEPYASQTQSASPPQIHTRFKAAAATPAYDIRGSKCLYDLGSATNHRSSKAPDRQ